MATDKTTLWLKHAAEVVNNEGPTGNFVEVLTGEVQDYGGNVLFAGSADECVAEKWRIPTRLVPKTTRKVNAEVAGADHLWGYA